MADQLCTPSDLAAFLQQDIDTSTATLLIECSTAVVQAAAGGQRIVQVVGDAITLMGTTDNWLDLPQIPVTAVSSVTLDGTALTVGTDYQVFGNRLFRKLGWQTAYGWPWDYPYSQPGNASYPPPSVATGYPYQQPSAVALICTHGYAPGRQELQLGRKASLTLAATPYSTPDGAGRVQIDDYAAAYDQMAARMESTPSLKAALRKQYGRRSGLVRIG